MSNTEKVTKTEVEEMLGHVITQIQFDEALEYAQRKQKYIYSQEKREVVMQNWYLAILTKEYVISLAFQKFTMDLCELRRNMEKEHFTHSCESAPIAPPIVSVPV